MAKLAIEVKMIRVWGNLPISDKPVKVPSRVAAKMIKRGYAVLPEDETKPTKKKKKKKD